MFLRLSKNPLRAFPPKGYAMVSLPLAMIAIIKLLRKAPQFDPCIICPPVANKFHTLKLICIFVEVHASAKNDLDLICRCGGKLPAAVCSSAALRMRYPLAGLRGFFDKLKNIPDASPGCFFVYLIWEFSYSRARMLYMAASTMPWLLQSAWRRVPS